MKNSNMYLSRRWYGISRKWFENDSVMTRKRVENDSVVTRLCFGKILAVLAIIFSIGVGNVWGEDKTATWTATSGGLGTGIGSGTITDNKSYTWNYTRTLISGSSNTGWQSNCIQLGKNGGVENLTLTTSNIPGTIKSVAVECSSYQAKHNVSITVGESTYLASTATPQWTTIDTKTGTGTSSGTITISFTGGTRALYIKSISVTYEEGATCTEAPTVTAPNKGSVSLTGATLSCSSGLSALGGCDVSSYGYVWGTSASPTISSSGKYEVGTTYTTTGTAFATYTITGLTPGTTYYYGAYATNAGGTSYNYNSNATFTTPSLTASSNNNSYGTVSVDGLVITATPASGYVYASPAYTITAGNGTTTIEKVGNTFTVTSSTSTEDVNVQINFEAKGCSEHAGTNVVSGTSADVSTYGPVQAYYKYSVRQILYTKTDLGLAAGKKGAVKSIYFQYAGASAMNARDITIYMANTDLTELSTSNYVPFSSFSEVYNGTFSCSSAGWYEIILDDPFEYNGAGNLVVLIDDNTGSYESSKYFKYHEASTTTGAQIYYNYDYSHPDPSADETWSTSSTATNNRPNTKFCIQEADMVKSTVSFDTGTANPSVASRTEATAGAGITLPSTSDLTPTCSADGWELYGWATAAYGSASTTTAPSATLAGLAGDTYYPTSDETLYAVYRQSGSSESASTTYTLNGDWTTDNGNWTKVSGSLSSSLATGKYGINSGSTSATSPVSYSNISEIVFTGTKSSSGAGSVAFYYGSGDSWTLIESKSFGTSLTWTIDPAVSGNLKIVFTRTAGNIYIASIKVTYDASTYNYWSNPTCCTPLGDINGAVTSINHNSATLQWDKLSNVDGSTPYEVTVSPSAGVSVGGIDLSGAKAQCTITGLTCESDYTFTITANGASGYCNKSQDVAGTTTECLCSDYSFHYGPAEGAWSFRCFTQVGSSTEWQIEDFTIGSASAMNKFYVGYQNDFKNSGLGTRGAKSKTETLQDQLFFAEVVSCDNRATVRSASNSAEGAVGTLRIYQDSEWDNLQCAFLPNGYGLMYGGSSASGNVLPFTYVSTGVWETDLVTLTADMKKTDNSYKYQVGLATATEGTYIACGNSLASNFGDMGSYYNSGWNGNISTYTAGTAGKFQIWSNTCNNGNSIANWVCHFIPYYTINYYDLDDELIATDYVAFGTASTTLRTVSGHGWRNVSTGDRSASGSVTNAFGSSLTLSTSQPAGTYDFYLVAPGYTVTFSTPACVATPSPITSNSVTLPAEPETTPDGYTFEGWTTDAAISGTTTTKPTVYAAGSTYNPTAATTMRAVYSTSSGSGSAVPFDILKNSASITAGYYLISYGQTGTIQGCGNEIDRNKISPIEVSSTGAAATMNSSTSDAVYQFIADGDYWQLKNMANNKFLAITGEANKVEFVNSVTDAARWSVNLINGDNNGDTHYIICKQQVSSQNYYLRYKDSKWAANYYSVPATNGCVIYLFYKSVEPSFGVTYNYTTNPTCKFVVSVSSPDNVTITATPSGGSAVAEGGNSGATVTAGTTVTLSGTPDACYENVVWTVTRADGEANVLTAEAASSFTMPASDVTVTASVSAKTNYTITYTIPSGGGSAVSPVTETCSGSTITLPNVTGISSEYSCETFLGWTTTAPNGSGTWASTPSYKAAGATSDAITGNTTFYAVYSRSGGGASGTVELTQSVIQAAYTSGSAYYNASNNIAYGTERSITAADGSVWTVTAQQTNANKDLQIKNQSGTWIKLPTVGGNYTSVSITCNSIVSARTFVYRTTADGSNLASGNISGYGTSGTIDLSDVGTTSGYIYDNSGNVISISNISASYGPAPIISHSLECGCDIDEFDLTYDANATNFAGSEIDCDAVSGWNFENDGDYTFCSDITPPSGYKFKYWSMNANGSGDNHWEAGEEVSCVPDDDITVYAIYERVYTVTFNDQGTITNRTQASEGASVKVPAHTTPCTDEENEPDEYTWTFAGWSTTASLSGSLTPGLVLNATTGAENADYTPTADITLYAVYQKTTATSDAFQNGKTGAYTLSAVNGSGVNAGLTCYATSKYGSGYYCSTTPPATDPIVYFTYYSAGTYAGLYTIQSSDGKYASATSTSGSFSWEDTPNENCYLKATSVTGGYQFEWWYDGSGTGSYFTHDSRFGQFRSAGDPLILTPTAGSTYFTTMTCDDEFDMTFSMSSGSIVWDALSSADFLNKADGTVISTFPTATLEGWTFIGWTAGSQYNSIYGTTGYYSEQNSNNVDPIGSPAVGGAIYGGSYGGSSYTMHSDIVMYPVFTKLEDNVPFDDINGGDYYIYYMADYTPSNPSDSQNDRYAGTHRVYATAFTGSVNCSGTNTQFGGTVNCENATVFTFTKLANGNWTIYDNTMHGYVTGKSDNGLQECTSDDTGWSFVQSGSKWILTYTSGKAFIADDGGHGAIAAEFQNFNVSTLTSSPTLFHYIYIGSCTERIFSSNPTNTPNVEIHGTVKVTATNGQMVKATSVLSVTGNNLTTSTVTVASSSADFKLSTSANSGTFAQSITIPVVSNQVAPTAVYVAYSPSETTDGINNTVTVSVKDDPSDPAAEASTSAGDIQGRHLPENFVIVAKTGNIWVALPSDLTGVVPQEYSIVTVDNVSDPTKATYAKATDIWNLNKVHDTNGASQDRWGSYGTNALFVSDVDSKCLYATTSADPTTGIGTYATAATYYETNPLFYEWALSSSDLETYTLVNQNTTQTNKTLTYNPSTQKWGMYSSGGNNIQEVRLLPIENTLDDMNWDVMEWDGAKPAFSGATSASGSIYYKITNADGTVPSGSVTSVSYTRLSGDIVKPSSNMAIAANAGRILMLFDASTPTKMTSIEIPHIVTSTETSTEMGTAYDGMDVVVRSGGQITANNKARSFKTLTVYPGGKVYIPDNTTITVKQLMIRGGYSFLDNSFAFPEIYLTGTGDLAGSTNAIYDYFIDNNHFYLLTLPYDVNLTKVTDEIGYANFSSWIQYYDGATRASGDQVSGWIDYDGTDDTYFGNAGTSGTQTDDKFEKGRGYLLAARPRRGKSVYNYAMVRDRAYAIVRFPLGNANKINNSTTGELSTKSIDVTAPGFTAGVLNDGVKPNNAGWNFVGNPFMSSFGGTEGALAGGSNITVGYLAKTPNEDGSDWNGNYEWKEKENRYITKLNPITGVYSQGMVASTHIEAFNAFFIQTKVAGTLTFAPGGRVVPSMPALRAQQEASEIAFEILLSDSASSDNTGLLIGNAFSEDYEFGDDLTKVASENQLAIYTQTGGYDLAFNAIPESVAVQPIPVGFTAPDSNAYVISLKETASLNLLESVVLKDYEKGGFETDLLVSDYEFNTHAVKQNNTRFTITVKVKHNSGTLTDIDTVGADGFDQIGIAVGNGTITLHGVPADAMVFVYDMTGKLLHNKISTDERMQLSVPQGVYNIRVQTPTGGRTLRTVVH